MVDSSLYSFIDGVFSLLYFLLMAKVILSWIPHNPFNPIIQILNQVTEPMLSPFRDLIPAHRLGGLDLSPILAFLALGLIKKLVLLLI